MQRFFVQERREKKLFDAMPPGRAPGGQGACLVGLPGPASGAMSSLTAEEPRDNEPGPGSSAEPTPEPACGWWNFAMGISRDSRHKHYKTGGSVPSEPTKLPSMGKYRALRLDAGNYAWGSENIAKKVRILDVVYNATSNELVRTKTLLKNTIVQIDAHPFMQYYQKKYGLDLGKKKKTGAADKGDKKEEAKEEVKLSRHVIAKQKARAAKTKLDTLLEEQFQSGRLLACIASRPGQCGRADGYVLEGEETESSMGLGFRV
ncbi:RPS8 [Symbiodinium natans]|uniref:RPS8 protein n=1 Tax=Symbiodinium natans TaxID=878477 RepID=A0A812Q1T6_9DINO|nr:RPS8 [Symbiodinium natans]